MLTKISNEHCPALFSFKFYMLQANTGKENSRVKRQYRASVDAKHEQVLAVFTQRFHCIPLAAVVAPDLLSSLLRQLLSSE